MQKQKVQTLPREIITNTLETAIASYSLVVLVAPMGYGKTTALRALKRKLNQRVFTITFAQGKHNALYFWEIACGQLAGQGSEIASAIHRTGFPSDQVELQRFLSQSRDYLSTQPTTVIIDDYHFVNSAEVNNFIETIARAEIPNLTIVIASRTRPDLHLEDMQLKGLATVFNHNLLKFSQQDAQDYFHLHNIPNATVAEAAWLVSEGWPAAMWLSLQSYLTHGVISPMNSIEKLLSETVFSQYDTASQRLLLQLSILDNFTLLQAATITEDDAAPQRIRQLDNQNAFLNYAANSDSYYLHSLFRSFLVNRLHEYSNPSLPHFIDKTALYRKAGEWFSAQNDIFQAIHFYHLAGAEDDQLCILQLLAQPHDGMCIMFDPEGIAALVKSIPWSVREKCPIGYLSFIYHYMSRANLDEGLALLDEAKQCFTSNKALFDKERSKMEGEIELIYGIKDFNDLYAMRDRHEKAYKLLQGRSRISHSQLIWTFGSPHASFLYLRNPGTYKKQIELVEENLFYYQEMTGGCSAGAQGIFRAEYILETGEKTSSAEPYLEKSVYKAVAKDQLSSLIAVNFAKARIHLAEGEPAKVDLLLDDLAPIITQAGSSLLSNSLDLLQGYIASVRQREKDIPLWLRGGKLEQEHNFYQGANFATIVHGKAQIVTKNWMYLQTLAEDIPAQLGAYNNLFGRIHALVLQAIATFHLQGQEQALTLLDKAVALARPDNIICTIAEYGAHIHSLLVYLRDWHPNDTFLKRLIKYSKRYNYLNTTTRMVLTPREQEVLERAMSGASNKAIGEALGITPASVGNTLTRVYTKLGVTNRTGAAQKWSELSS